MNTAQLNFENCLGLTLPRLGAANPGANTRTWPEDMLGNADVMAMQADGWGFSQGGIKLGNCWSVWAEKEGVFKMCYLADPDLYPEAWAEAEGGK